MREKATLTMFRMQRYTFILSLLLWVVALSLETERHGSCAPFPTRCRFKSESLPVAQESDSLPVLPPYRSTDHMNVDDLE